MSSIEAKFEAEVRGFLRSNLDWAVADQLWDLGQSIPSEDERVTFYHDILKDIAAKLEGTQSSALKDRDIYKWKPVGIREFIESEKFLNKPNSVYPRIMDELEEINNGEYIEVVFTGGIGSGKTTSALYTTAYQLYLLSCLKSPHKLFGLDSSSEILFIFQSLNAALAKGVDYNRFRDMVEGSPYFRSKFMFDKNMESKLVFPNRIEVHPVSGKETAAIGQNVIGGIIDELNYMAVTSKSKQSVDAGTYDQAVALYNSIARRRKSRFMSGGKMPGILCLVSSKKYPGQFTDTKEDEQKREIARTGKSTIYIYDRRVWDVKPEQFAEKGFFNVFAGDLARKPRILKADETVDDADRHLVVAVPMDFYEDFEKDIINALREIAGISTLARHPYFVEVHHLDRAFKRHNSIFNCERTDFVSNKIGLRKGEFYRPELPRFVHVDLALTGDSAGLAIGTVVGFQPETSDPDGAVMPIIRIDGVLEIAPPKNAEIQFWKVRELIIALRKHGLNVRWVTFDSFQSKDSQQILRQQGFIVGEQSMDINNKPYDYTKSAVYAARLMMPEHAKCRLEMVALERDTKSGKIDHPPNLSKDCSDAVAGVVYGLTQRREVWGMYKIPLVKIPSSIQSTKLEDKNQKLAGADHTHETGIAA
jgi:hypothetical protein